eukprot:985040-Pelagomonas_calceolata.AAC.1
MDVPLSWKELTRVTDRPSKVTLEVGGVAVAGAGCSLFPPRPLLLLNGYRESVLGTLFIGTIKIAPGRPEMSLCLSGEMEGELTWIGWVSGSTLLQGTS